MGVEQIVRDEFAAASEYKNRWASWRKSKKGMPPRRDLELDAIVEILDGERKIHCHSYRQDEILALMRTCEAFGVRLKVFQHILEGYKVADVMAKHGAALLAVAAERGVRLLYEAAVGGGIPIISPLSRDLLANEITAVTVGSSYDTKGFLAIPDRRWMSVRPTALDEATARLLTKWWPENAKADSDVTDQDLAEFHLMLYGGPEMNKLTARMADRLPETRVEIETGVQEAASIPWELLCDPLTQIHLALHARAFVRAQSEAASQPTLPALAEDEPVRILLVICRPGRREDVPFRSVAMRLLKGLDPWMTSYHPEQFDDWRILISREM